MDKDLKYERSGMHKEAILAELRRRGYRITRQRELLLDVILNEEYTCCKEIYYLAAGTDPHIGIATIYRMLNVLEDIGAVRRSRAYHIEDNFAHVYKCRISFEDETYVSLDYETFLKVMERGMASLGYLKKHRIKSVCAEQQC